MYICTFQQNPWQNPLINSQLRYISRVSYIEITKTSYRKQKQKQLTHHGCQIFFVLPCLVPAHYARHTIFKILTMLICMQTPHSCCNYNKYSKPLDLISQFVPNGSLTAESPCYWAHKKDLCVFALQSALCWSLQFLWVGHKTLMLWLEPQDPQDSHWKGWKTAVRMCHCCSLCQWPVCQKCVRVHGA